MPGVATLVIPVAPTLRMPFTREEMVRPVVEATPVLETLKRVEVE